jgi:hypothetical protein
LENAISGDGGAIGKKMSRFDKWVKLVELLMRKELSVSSSMTM